MGVLDRLQACLRLRDRVLILGLLARSQLSRLVKGVLKAGDLGGKIAYLVLQAGLGGLETLNARVQTLHLFHIGVASFRGLGHLGVAEPFLCGLGCCLIDKALDEILD